MKTIHIPPGCIDHHLRTYREPETTFILQPGAYSTQGCFGFPEHDLCMLAPQCSIIGAGSAVTMLLVKDPVIEHGGRATGYYEALTGGARSRGGSLRTQVQGLSILMDKTCPGVGVHLWSSSVTITDVVVSRVWGARTWAGSVKEGFGLLVNNAAQATTDGNHRISGCVVYAEGSKGAGETYVTGIYVGAVSRASSVMLPSEVSDCSVICLDGGRAHAALAANAHTRFRRCYVNGFRRAMFCDTGPVVGITVSELTAHGVEWALDLRVAHSGDERVGIRLKNSEFRFAVTPDGWAQALLLSDDTGDASTRIRDVELVRCKFEATDVPNASKGRCRGRVSEIYEKGCRWLGKWQPPILQGGALPWEVVA